MITHSTTPRSLSSAKSMGTASTHLYVYQKTNQTKFMHGGILVEEEDPCTESYAEIYYNRPDVQRAMHANLTSIPYKWTVCNEILFKYWDWGNSDHSMLPTYKELMAAGLRIWVFR